MNSPLSFVKRVGLLAIAVAAVFSNILAAPSPAAQADNLKRVAQAGAYVEKALSDVTILLPPATTPDIHPKAISLGLAINFLRGHSDALVSAEQKSKIEDQLDAIASAALRLSKASDNGDSPGSAAQLDEIKALWTTVKSEVPAGLFAARLDPPVYGCIMHGSQTSAVPGTCPICGMVLVPKQAFQVAITEPLKTVVAEIQTPAPLQAGVETNALLHLHTASGKPVPISDLLVIHTQPIHLLVVDQGLSDYHHIHPKPTGVPGEYAFAFTPSKPGSYRAFADIVPVVTGQQEYAQTDIPGAGDSEALSNKDTILQSQVEDLRYTLTFSRDHLVRGEPISGKLHIDRASDHLPFKSLEPLMGVFAHFVGFHEDRETVMHIHPQGPDPVPPDSHGGPDLEFQFIPMKAGFIRFYAQVQIGGVDKFAPFQLNVEEPKAETDKAGATASAASP